MDFIKITEDKFREYLAEYFKNKDEYYFHHALAYEALLQDFGVSQERIKELREKARQTK